jgi:hypothetical protein
VWDEFARGSCNPSLAILDQFAGGLTGAIRQPLLGVGAETIIRKDLGHQ